MLFPYQETVGFLYAARYTENKTLEDVKVEALTCEPAVAKSRKQKRKWVRNPRPYNLAMDNPMFLAELEYVENLLLYTFKDRILAREMLFTIRARDGLLENGILLPQFNYALALVGDDLLRTVLLYVWWREPLLDNRRPCGDPMQERLKEFITEKSLKVVAQKHGLTALMSKWYPRDGQKEPCNKAITTTVEAIIGAVFLDSGRDLPTTERILSKLLGINLMEDPCATPSQAEVRTTPANDQALAMIDKLHQGVKQKIAGLVLAWLA